jgi:hypothetical protein
LFAKIGSVVDHALQQLANRCGQNAVIAMNLMEPRRRPEVFNMYRAEALHKKKAQG